MAKKIVTNRFAELLARKERIERRRITRATAAAETGIAKSTIQTYARNEVTLYAGHIVATLCDYLGCEIGELLVIEDTDEQQETPFAA